MSQGFTRGIPIDTDPTLSLNSDLVVPSQKAIKDYVDTGLNTKQDTITLTTTGTSGAATLSGATLNIPQYSGTVTGVTATSPITSSGGTAPVISTSMATNRLIGRSTAGTGVMEEIQLGNFLTLNSGVLSSVPPTPMSQDYAAAWNIAPTIVSVANGTGSTGSANSWLFVARYFSPNTVISQIGLRVDAFTTNVTLRLAIYDSTYDSTNARFVPANRVANSGALSVTGLGFYSYSLPSSIQVSGWVFFAVGFTGAGCSYRNVVPASIIGLPAQVTTGTPQGTQFSSKNGRYDNTTVSTSADPPNPWSGALNQNNANIPAVYFFIP